MTAKISAETQVFGIIGEPVSHSLSPRLHNAAYEALGVEARFVYVAFPVSKSNLAAALAGIRALEISGVACTVPHKTAVMQYLDAIDTEAQTIGAVNTIVNKHGRLIGYNTDVHGALVPLERVQPVAGKQVALLGAGGAARAAAFALKSKGAQLSIFNRSIDKAQALASQVSAQAHDIQDEKLITACEIIINATSVGMHPAEYHSPVKVTTLKSHHIVFDMVYKPRETKLLRDARGVGAKTIEGLEMLLHQGIAQFELFTGLSAPQDCMRKTLFEDAHDI